MAEFQLGMNAAIYFGAPEDALSAMTELTNAREVTLNMSAGESDITTRANSGWRATAPTLRECTVDFTMIWKPGDAGFDAIRTAFLANDTIELAILDDDKANTGAQGPKGRFSILNFERNEDLEEAITVAVSAKLAEFDVYVIV